MNNRIFIGPRPIQPGTAPGPAQPRQPLSTGPAQPRQPLSTGPAQPQQPLSTGPAQPQQPLSTGPAPAGSFKQLLDNALTQPIKFSGHAQERLAASRRELTEAEMAGLSRAVAQAAQKGARDALVLMKDMALVVSVKNRTVITAVDGDRMKDNIFTNIDSAVIL